MIEKLRRRSFGHLAGSMALLAVLGFVGCTGGGTPNFAPVEGESDDDPEIAAIKNSGKRPDEIRRLVLETLKAKRIADAKKSQGTKGARR